MTQPVTHDCNIAAEVERERQLTKRLAARLGVQAGSLTFDEVVGVVERRLHVAQEGHDVALALNQSLRASLDLKGEVLKTNIDRFASVRARLAALAGVGGLSEMDDILASIDRRLTEAESSAIRGDLAMRVVFDLAEALDLQGAPDGDQGRDDDVVRWTCTAVAAAVRDLIEADEGEALHALHKVTGRTTLAGAIDYIRGAVRMAQGFQRVRDCVLSERPTLERISADADVVIHEIRRLREALHEAQQVVPDSAEMKADLRRQADLIGEMEADRLRLRDLVSALHVGQQRLLDLMQDHARAEGERALKAVG